MIVGSEAASPRLSVVVCTYNRYDALPNAIASLLAQRLNTFTMEILVVDNSPDQIAAGEFAKRYDGLPVRYILEAKPGLSNARNVGISASRGELVGFIDDDAIASPDWASEIVRAFDNFGDRAGSVGGRVMPRWVTERPHWLPDRLLSYLSIVDWGGELRELPRYQWLAGCNLAYRRAVLDSVGGFSLAVGRIGPGEVLLSGEDSDMAAKIAAGGWTTVYAPSASVEHAIDPARLTPQWFHRRVAWHAVSEFVLNPERMSRFALVAKERLRLVQGGSRRPVPLGFVAVPDSAAEFERDVMLTYDLAVALLAGGVDLEVPPAENTMAAFRIKAIARVRHLAAKRPLFARLLRAIYRIRRT
jgi:GT2 family glycosyltransferase